MNFTAAVTQNLVTGTGEAWRGHLTVDSWRCLPHKWKKGGATYFTNFLTNCFAAV